MALGKWQPAASMVTDKGARKSLDDLAERLARGSVPIGARLGWNTTAFAIPEFYLSADGSTPLIASYPELASLYGTTYGGNGTTTFGLPTEASTIIRAL